jgi:WD40 repeat protein
LLLAAVADGAIWRLDGTARVLYRHRDMPDRLTLSNDCSHVVSGAHDGSLILYDLQKNHIEDQLPHAHASQITQVVLQGSDIVTSGADAAIRRWHVGEHGLQLSTDTREAGSVGPFRSLTGGWVAAIDEHTLVMRSSLASRDLQLAVGRPITDIALSADERYVAVSDLDEVIVIDRLTEAIATAYNPGSDIACIRFIAGDRIAACDTSSILMLLFEKLKFIPLNSK